MFIVNNKKIFFIISAVVVAFSLFSIFFWGVNPSIEFTGGSIAEIRYVENAPALQDIKNMLSPETFGAALVQQTGDNGFIIRTKELDEAGRAELFKALSFEGKQSFTEERYSLIGPSIGTELRAKAWIAILVVLLVIILFVAFAFRKVSQGSVESIRHGASSWHYGIAALIALAHDIIIPTGIFAFLGSRFVDAQIDTLFVTALLAILGYSVHDTIVVFDRVRENVRKNQEFKMQTSFAETVGTSLYQTMGRSINTSLTTFLVLLALFFIGTPATANFVLVLGIGVLVGTYSSVFLASPLLVALAGLRRKN